MSRVWLACVRMGAVIVALALLGQFLQPQRAFAAPAIAVTKVANPTSMPAPGGLFTFSVTVSNPGSLPMTISGLSDNVYGNLFTRAGSTCGGLSGITVPVGGTAVACSFTTTLTGAAGTTQTDTVTVSAATVPASTTFTSTAVATISLTAPTATPALSLDKTVNDFHCPVGGSCTATPGTTLIYQLNYQNTGGAGGTANSVVVRDILNSGQQFVSASVGCTFNGASTVNCSIGSVPGSGGSSSGFVRIQTRVTGTTGTIQNTGEISGTNVGGGNYAPSNTTYVTIVNGGCTGPSCVPNPCNYNSCTPNPCAYNCNPTPCSYSCNPNPCSHNNCNPNPCAYNCNPTPCSYSCNPNPCSYNNCNPNPCAYNCNPSPCATGCGTYGAPLVCGLVTTYTPATATTTGTVIVGAATAPYTVAPGTYFNNVAVKTGQSFCFILNSVSYITGCLSAIPTSITDSVAMRVGRMVVD